MSERFDRRRRRLLLGGVAGMLAFPCWSAGRLLTPRQTAGPFYPDLPLLDRDNDLTRVEGRAGIALGRIAELSGQVLDSSGNPLPGVRVEIWQCDANGRYRHSGDTQGSARDEHFQGFGHAVTDDRGRYRFRTIRPVPYPGRTPHIHAAVFRQGRSPFVTQIYVADEPRNSEDVLYRRMPSELRPLVEAEFLPSVDPEVELTAQFDFVLAEGIARASA